jgi:hypothetical protein
MVIHPDAQARAIQMAQSLAQNAGTNPDAVDCAKCGETITVPKQDELRPPEQCDDA